MAAVVGDALATQIAAAEDEAISHEWTEVLGGATVAKVYGRKGLYVASPDSGEWVAAGPFPDAE